jgi:hypothetical protein
MEVLVLVAILLIIVVAVVVPSSKKGLRKCPQCAEWVKNEALKCRFCQHDFTSTAAHSPHGSVSASHK